MRKLMVALCVGAVAALAMPALAATDSSSNGAVKEQPQPQPDSHRPKPPKCQEGYKLEWACTKQVPTPRPKDFPKNEPWLGEKCVQHGWVCQPPIK
jgi:hypothetical protein